MYARRSQFELAREGKKAPSFPCYGYSKLYPLSSRKAKSAPYANNKKNKLSHSSPALLLEIE